jgi:DNA repair protein RadC
MTRLSAVHALPNVQAGADDGVEALADFLRLAGCASAARDAAALLRGKPLAGMLSTAIASPNDSGVDRAATHALGVLHRAILAVLRREIEQRPVIASYEALTDYLHAGLAHEPVETLRILFLDCRNHLIADEEFAHGTVDHVAIYPRRIMKRALELEASGVILVHNHPSGDPAPSEGDMEATRQVVAAGRTLGVTVHDHIIIARQGHRSLLHPPVTQPRRWFARAAA